MELITKIMYTKIFKITIALVTFLIILKNSLQHYNLKGQRLINSDYKQRENEQNIPYMKNASISPYTSFSLKPRERFHLSTACARRPLSAKHLSRLQLLNNTEQLLYKVDKSKINDNFNTVMGLAYGYEKHQLYIFIESLKKRSYKGEIILFLKESVSEETKTYLRGHNVTIFYMTEDWPYYSPKNVNFPLKSSTIENKILKKVLTTNSKFFIIRFLLFNAYLHDYGDINRMYMMIDTKDTFFQLHPFSYNLPRGVIINEEPRIATIREEKSNLVYMSKFKPKSDKIYQNFIYNAGCFYFTYPEILDIFEDFNRLIKECEHSNIVDQAAFIISIVENPKSYYYFFTDGFGPVRNIGIEIYSTKIPFRRTSQNDTVSEVFTIKEEKIINYDCSIPAIIHMYTQYKTKELTNFLNDTLKSK